MLISFLERRRMCLGKWKPYLTETCTFPGTDRLFDSFKTILLISSGQWVAWSTFFAKLKWHEVALVKMVTSQWFCVLKEHLLATDTTKAIPVFFVLSFTLHCDVTSFWTIREASLDTVKDSGRCSRSVTTEASVNNASMYLCLINNPSQCLSRNFKVDSVILSNNFVT